MKKANVLLTMCIIILTLSLTCTAAYAADAPATEGPVSPSGTVYTAGVCGQTAVAQTTVDYVLDGAGQEFGAVCDGGSYYYYGADISGVVYGVSLDGTRTCYFGSSNGAIPLYDTQGDVSGIVWGDRRTSSVECDVGFFLTGEAGNTVVEDGTVFSCVDAIILSQGSGSFHFCNARLETATGELAVLEPGAGDMSIVYSNGTYTGDHINAGDGTLSITVDRGALLFGDMMQTGVPLEVTVSAGGIWTVKNCSDVTLLTVEEGGTVYGEITEDEDGMLILLPSDTMLEPGVYASSPVAEDIPVDPATEEETEPEQPILPDEPEEDIPVASEESSAAGPLFPLPADDQQPITEDLPFGHGPAVAQDDAEAEQSSLPDEPEEDIPAAEDGGPSVDSLFPLVPATPDDDSKAPEPDGDEPLDADIAPASEEEPEGLSSALLEGAGLAKQLGLFARPDAVSPSVDLAACLAHQSTGHPISASLLKTGAKTHSFLPEALDKQFRILYNPYCCLAA